MTTAAATAMVVFKPAPDLAAMPAETFEFIAEYLDPIDLRNLRLANRECASKVLRTYTTVHFTEQAFFLSSHGSLEIACAVAKHPVFGKAVRKILLYLDVVQTYEEFCSQYRPYSGTGARYYEEMDFNDCIWLDHRTLATAFGHFREWAAVDEIEFVDLSMQRRKPVFPAMAQVHPRGPYQSSASCSTAIPLELVLGALKKSGLGIKSLLVDRTIWSCPLRKQFDYNGIGVLQSLQRLHLSFWHELYMDPPTVFGHLAATRNLKYLKLRVARRGTEWSKFHWIWDFTFLYLETFTLVGGLVRLETMEEFAKRHPWLRKLGLSGIKIQDPVFWDNGYPRKGQICEDVVRQRVRVDGEYEDVTYCT